MVTKKFGQALGMISTVIVIISVFLAYVSLDFERESIFSMSLTDYNSKGAIVMVLLAVLGLIASYFGLGIITGVMGIAIFVANFYFFTHSGYGGALGEGMKLVSSFIGEMSPGIGFWVAAGGALLMFFAGILINKGKTKSLGEGQGQIKKK